MRESYFEDECKRVAKAIGGEVRKVKWIGRVGAPDKLLLLPNWHPMIEFKATGKFVKKGSAQYREHERLRAAGFETYVVNSYVGLHAVFSKHADYLSSDVRVKGFEAC